MSLKSKQKDVPPTQLDRTATDEPIYLFIAQDAKVILPGSLSNLKDELVTVNSANQIKTRLEYNKLKATYEDPRF